VLDVEFDWVKPVSAYIPSRIPGTSVHNSLSLSLQA